MKFKTSSVSNILGYLTSPSPDQTNSPVPRLLTVVLRLRVQSQTLRLAHGWASSAHCCLEVNRNKHSREEKGARGAEQAAQPAMPLPNSRSRSPARDHVGRPGPATHTGPRLPPWGEMRHFCCVISILLGNNYKIEKTFLK